MYGLEDNAYTGFTNLEISECVYVYVTNCFSFSFESTTTQSVPTESHFKEVHSEGKKFFFEDGMRFSLGTRTTYCS